MQSAPIINAFKRVLGESNIAVGQRQTEHYRKGWRSGEGEALAVLFPHTLKFALSIIVLSSCRPRKRG